VHTNNTQETQSLGGGILQLECNYN